MFIHYLSGSFLYKHSDAHINEMQNRCYYMNGKAIRKSAFFKNRKPKFAEINQQECIWGRGPKAAFKFGALLATKHFFFNFHF